jgi:DNA polymerase III delta prime subunit
LERALKSQKLPNVLNVTDREPLVVVVLGPTASGKTALALAIARRFGGEIVNCDSVAMYREFDIGTAKPSAAERVEIPHHLLDCVDPLADVSAGEYARQARQILREISSAEEPDSIFALCLKDFCPARSDPKSCATDCAPARRRTGPSTCTASCGGSTLRRRAAFTPMTFRK